MTIAPSSDRALPLVLQRDGACLREVVARRHGRRRNPARRPPRSSLRTLTSRLQHNTHRWVRKVGRSDANSETPQSSFRSPPTTQADPRSFRPSPRGVLGAAPPAQPEASTGHIGRSPPSPRRRRRGQAQRRPGASQQPGAVSRETAASGRGTSTHSQDRPDDLATPGSQSKTNAASIACLASPMKPGSVSSAAAPPWRPCRR